MATPRERMGGAHDEVFAPIHTTNAFEQLVERLGRAIKLGLLQPGERIPSERVLAEQVGLSRSTVREATRILVEAGFLVTRRGNCGGTFVAEELPVADAADGPMVTDAHELRDLTRFRLCLELGAAELACGRASAEQCERLGAVIDECADEEWPDAYASYRAADGRFHIGLARIAGSTRLVAELTCVHAQLGELLTHLPHSAAALQNSTAQHRRVLAAVSAGDPAGAREAMREHVCGTERLLLALLPAR